MARAAMAGEATPRDTATSDPGRPAPTFQDAGSAAVAAGVAQRMADGSVVFSGTRGTRVIQRATATTEPPAPAPLPDPPPITVPDPEPSADAPTFPDATAPEVPGDPESAPPGSPAAQGTATGTGAATPPVTDELVRALYAPLSRLLKADLRLERERAGFLINTRH
ncbi:hypothetical protein ACFU76_09125 [Streptomyces sp. NPDC057539]|uniref:hypothetical protein n=1 Tax=Streptomyces sp. NPDC057539 TaxID=3346159 RepID=UPI0036966A21